MKEKKLTKRNNGRGHPYVTMGKGDYISMQSLQLCAEIHEGYPSLRTGMCGGVRIIASQGKNGCDIVKLPLVASSSRAVLSWFLKNPDSCK
jgi:hypothetical protein